jgi:outer membrane lipoprotein-sorting protein
MLDFKGIRLVVLPIIFFTLVSSSCLVRTRTVAPPGKAVNLPLLKATRDELVQKVRDVSDRIKTFQMRVDLSPSVGALYGGQVTDYPTITGVVLFKRPDDIRVIGLDPVVHGTAFDMLSSGNDFRVSIPPKSEFVEGHNDTPANSPNKLENLRPDAFRTALLVAPPDLQTDIIILADDTNETKAVYILHCIRHEGEEYKLVRNLYFDRHSLKLSRQKTFDAQGYIKSDTKYSDWREYAGVPFPASIDIQRPQDGYELLLKVTDMKMNISDLGADRFVLEQPAGSQLKILK